MMILISTGEACVLSPFDMKLTYRCVCVCVHVVLLTISSMNQPSLSLHKADSRELECPESAVNDTWEDNRETWWVLRPVAGKAVH